MKKISSENEIKLILERISSEIKERHIDMKKVSFIGIKRHGDILAERLKYILSKDTGIKFNVGALDITFYRDDLQMISELPEVKSTEINFDVNGREIILVDDVLYTARTIRAALSEILDFGRPSRIELAVLIDRKQKELPICPDYVGKIIPSSKEEIIDVFLKELEGKDAIFIRKKDEPMET